jgi:hypothetical protein
MNMSDEIIAEIKRRILVFIVDNPRLAGLQMPLETAALIGAIVACELKDAEGLDSLNTCSGEPFDVSLAE